ncbi:MAG: hypothetical protein H7A23_11305 [Leptospiraceae bacterium]|nr:hypothetical protein [Leptospiraceae bacterium]MCP5495132.1 hypothetical protein [Leptospiraceae bacterium]
MKKFILLFMVSFSFSILSQGEENQSANTPPTTGSSLEPQIYQKELNQYQKGDNIEKEEEHLNKVILQANRSFEGHSKILLMKLKVFPRNTVLTRGVAQGNDCIYDPNKSQEDVSNDCLKIEVFDFVKGDGGKEVGEKSKYVILFFDKSEDGKTDYVSARPRRIKKIKSRISIQDREKLDKRLLEITDAEPTAAPENHDYSIFTQYQLDNYPSLDPDKNPSKEEYFKLSDVVNTISSPIRNEFKRDAYIKHLQYFERLLSKIFYYNEEHVNNKARRNNNFLKGVGDF